MWVGFRWYCVGVSDLPVPPPPLGGWVGEAVCRGVRSDVFFPPSGVRPVEALRLCGVCPVRVECLEYAIENHQHWGVWGGLTERQRFALKRARRLGDPL